MEIITSHSRMDFDGMAGLIAAKKLYPNAIPIRLRGLQNNVHQFLSLHKEYFFISTLKQIDFSQITRVIMVDLHDPTRIPELKKVFSNPKVEIHVYDHHPIRGNLHPQITESHVEMVGSTATIFTRIFERQNVPLTPEEANALALGIYADTGNLTYLSTTPDDIYALSYLFKQGADIRVINHFIKVYLNRKQKTILYHLLKGKDRFRYQLNGHKILITIQEIDEYIDGLSEIVMKYKQIEDADASFVLFQVKTTNDVHIVARSRVHTIDVGSVLTSFGGGGQYAAAYAKVRKGDTTALRKKLYSKLSQQVRSKKRVKDAMISSVFCIPSNMSLKELDDEFHKRKIHGAPVVDDGKIVGVISIRDIDKARRGKLMHAPVKGYMSKNFKTIEPEVTLEEAEEKMLIHDIGRLPVVQNGKLIGIITRTDILRCLYKD